jgi:dipeptidyl aminopeptidase/acylaminoacyl peptidase
MLDWKRTYAPLVGGALVALGVGALSFYRACRVVRIEATCFHPPTGPVAVPAILANLPGRGDRRQLAPFARTLIDEGFGVLAFDFPGHGESGGRVTFGRCEVDALLQATSFLAAEPDVDPARIGAIGLSMGAVLLAVAAAEEPRLGSLVLISPFADSVEQTKNEVSRLNWLARWGTLAVDRYYMPDGPLRPVDAVSGIKDRSLLFVGVADDRTVPLAMTRQVYDAVDAESVKKDFFVVSAGGHANVTVLAAGACAERIVGFCR